MTWAVDMPIVESDEFDGDEGSESESSSRDVSDVVDAQRCNVRLGPGDRGRCGVKGGVSAESWITLEVLLRGP